MLTKDDYKAALAYRTSASIASLAYALSNVSERVWEEARAKGLGADFVHEHPIVKLYVCQMMHLSRKREYSEAWKICEEREKI